MSARFFLAQISDTHLRADDGGVAAAQLRKALSQAAEYRCDAILLTGDLANDERPEEYAALAEVIANPPAPLFLMPGNHDDRARIREAFPRHTYLPREGPLSYTVEDFPVRLVAVDQTVPGETHGLFTEQQARWLDKALSKHRKKPALVALHHPPFLTHDLLFDKIGLMEPRRFEKVIAHHPQVTRIICGHHHRVAVGQVAHAPVVVAPSTSWVYGLATGSGQEIAPRTAEQPGWMLHAWVEGSGFASHFLGL
ncbi:phosphodiesterase [Terricaulis sp.]|uniref:phosphodiesterase n=1 Tax=Terricaulis sp. TaxID=2768686 RepID=UPI003783FB57